MQTKPMLATIVINNYNYGAYVGQAIESCLAQTYQLIEIIVVDDGSTDNSRQVIERYNDPVRKVFQPNGGQTSAYNTGWKTATGNFILFLDSDDILLPNAIEKCMEKLTESGAEKVQFILQKVDKSLKPLYGIMPTYGLGHPNKILQDIKLWGFYLTPPGSGNMYSRKLLNEIMPAPHSDDTRYPFPPDGYLAAIAPFVGKVESLYEILGLYRVHGENMSVAGEVDSLAKLRRLFMIDYLREEQEMIWAAKTGFPYKSDRSRFHPTVCKQRFLAYRLDPATHPIRQDSYFGLLFAGIWGAVRFPYLSRKKRFFVAGGFLAIAIMPKRLLRHVIEAVVKPEKRKGFLSILRFGA